MSLRDTLYTQSIQPYLDTTMLNTSSDNQDKRDDWVQFVKDHLDWIKARSMCYDVTETVMPRVRYNLIRYMDEKGIDTQVWWIVLLLNNFKNDLDFDRNIYTREGANDSIAFMRIYLPPIEVISDLHEHWMTTRTVTKGSTLANNI